MRLPEPVSDYRCKVVGAGMAALWLLCFCVVFYGHFSPIALDSTPGLSVLGFAFLGLVAACPMSFNAVYRNGRAAFHLCVGGVMAAVPMLILVGMHAIQHASWPMQ